MKELSFTPSTHHQHIPTPTNEHNPLFTNDNGRHTPILTNEHNINEVNHKLTNGHATTNGHSANGHVENNVSDDINDALRAMEVRTIIYHLRGN